MTPPDFQGYLDLRRSEVDAALTRALSAVAAAPEVVTGAMQYSLMAGGKRLRPILCLASAEAVGGDRRLAIPAACALELIQTFSLIHDDLAAMDNDTMRRGRPTLHVVAGEGMAILAGDGLLTEAFHLIAREPATTDPVVVDRKLRVIAEIAHGAGAAGMVGGQAIDLASVAPDPSGRPPLTLDAAGLRAMHAMKTGALIRASAVSGAIMGGGTTDQTTAVDRAAAELGLAFQIVDDILDVEGASATLGKTAGKDAAMGKATYPALYGLTQSRRMAAECLERAEAALGQAAILDDTLVAIGRWIVGRSA